VEDTAFTITYAALLAASNATDVENDVISFRIESVTYGTFTKGGVAVVAGTTMLAVGESLVWTPSAQSNGLLNAFMVKAGDGTTFSATAVQVTASVAPVNDAPSFNISANIALEFIWTARMTDSQRNWHSIVSSADGTKLAAVATGDYIYTSTDSGVTWIARMTDIARTWISIASSADGMKLAAVGFDGIYTSTDAGVTWTARRTDITRQWRSIASSADGAKLTALHHERFRC
jgi:hypothetical protein